MPDVEKPVPGATTSPVDRAIVEVSAGILRVAAPLGDRVNGMYVLGTDDPVLLFDTGTAPDPAGTLAPAIRDRGHDLASLRFVIDSHSDVDHMGGNRAVRRLAPTASLMCGEADRALVEDVERIILERYREFGANHGIALEPGMAEWCRTVAEDTPVDVGLTGGERLALGRDWAVEVIPTPGHSPGSVSLYDPRSRALLIGDAVLGSFVPTADGRAAFPPTYRDVDAYLATIERVERLAPDILLASHEPVRRGEAVLAFLGASREFATRLEAAVRDALERARWTLGDLALELGPRFGDWPAEAHPIMRFPLLGHLERLVARGDARVDRETGRFVYAAARP
jgi:glyoxylase-like metal-dependent hydrolase (beta-lactamase superfamily II)